MGASLGLAAAVITRPDGSKLEGVSILARGSKVIVKRRNIVVIARPSVRVARIARRKWTIDVGPGPDGEPAETWAVERDPNCLPCSGSR